MVEAGGDSPPRQSLAARSRLPPARCWDLRPGRLRPWPARAAPGRLPGRLRPLAPAIAGEAVVLAAVAVVVAGGCPPARLVFAPDEYRLRVRPSCQTGRPRRGFLCHVAAQAACMPCSRFAQPR
jgi:hypothetical protein